MNVTNQQPEALTAKETELLWGQVEEEKKEQKRF